MQSSTQFEALRDFMGAYFHQDWMLDDETPDEVMSRFLAMQQPTRDELQALIAQIDAFTSAHPDDTTIEQALEHVLGCYYQPSADQRSAREWLNGVRARFVQAMEQIVTHRTSSDAEREY
ncbi:MAG: contact-dependent growth inhibition system immunity protein [Roseiflexaceae bacterium]|nr:contact-dependent growth inhibition system immunity protein [Roseiflexaceae bacterium]